MSSSPSTILHQTNDDGLNEFIQINQLFREEEQKNYNEILNEIHQS